MLKQVWWEEECRDEEAVVAEPVARHRVGILSTWRWSRPTWLLLAAAMATARQQTSARAG